MQCSHFIANFPKSCWISVTSENNIFEYNQNQSPLSSDFLQTTNFYIKAFFKLHLAKSANNYWRD